MFYTEIDPWEMNAERERVHPETMPHAQRPRGNRVLAVVAQGPVVAPPPVPVTVRQEAPRAEFNRD